jgi:acyl carrier protein
LEEWRSSVWASILRAAVTLLSDKPTVLDRIIAFCNELELLPGNAAEWIHADLVERQLLDSMTLLQLEVLVEHEFGVRIARAELVTTTRSLAALAAYVAAATA